MKIVLKLFFALAVVVGGYFSISWASSEEIDFVKVGDKVPAFELSNKTSKINAESLKGKVVLINFFATWCPPCVKELPHLEKEVWQEFKDNKDFVLLVVGREHSQEEIDKFAEGKGLDLPFYPDLERTVFGKFAKQNIPRNFIIDREGKIIYSAVGFNEEEFTKMKQLLNTQLK
ncbi:TlpA family protein disulfide reductase [Carboxylicivirga caseinilyticus]|uniref:TlpA family protein disulfide reductase n=1 Tax=Carboxylicivirga caseinilyticus TaxID=3417572 RepID=UPI003D338658|nr:redoxin domain-containing protein [Marinilabiliaceae bacterium A049]